MSVPIRRDFSRICEKRPLARHSRWFANEHSPEQDACGDPRERWIVPYLTPTTDGAVDVLNTHLNIDTSLIFGTAIMVQLCGLITLLASRFCRSDAQAVWNGLYFATLFMVGLITIISIRQESGHWLVSSTTLAIMVVGATFDSSESKTPATI